VDEFYRILGIGPGASQDDIKKAWIKLCQEVHPDKGGTAEAFIKVTHAYKMLTDPSYQFKETKKVRDLTFNIRFVVSFEEAFFGTHSSINYNRMEVSSSGEDVKTDKLESVAYVFKVPAGTKAGTTLEFLGGGMKCGSNIGNAVVTLLVQNHPKFRMAGMNVESVEKVPLHTLLKGGHITAETMWGQRKVWISPGTWPGKKVMIPNCGVGQGYNHILSIDILYPDNASLKTDTKWQDLKINWQDVEDEERRNTEELLNLYARLSGKPG
jgi:DnaJ-class molecular chaperone